MDSGAGGTGQGWVDQESRDNLPVRNAKRQMGSKPAVDTPQQLRFVRSHGGIVAPWFLREERGVEADNAAEPLPEKPRGCPPLRDTDDVEALLGHMAAPALEDASWVLHGPEAVARVVSEVDHPLGERRGGAGAHLVLPFGRELPQQITRSDDDMNRGRPERVGHAVDLLVRRSTHQFFADHRFPWVLVDLVDQRLPGPWRRWRMPVAAADLSDGVEVLSLIHISAPTRPY